MSAPRRPAGRTEKHPGLSYEHIVGLRFAVNVFIATTIVWITLRSVGDTDAIWAIASMVAASDPQPTEAGRMFRSRLINVLVGCVIGMSFLLFGGRNPWMLPLALATAVVICTSLVRVRTMWRQAPITAAIIIAGGLTAQSTEIGFEQGLHKVAEVVFGCFVGVVVSWLMARFWLIPPPDKPTEADESR
jgi:uncharacterized membrane protein YccC